MYFPTTRARAGAIQYQNQFYHACYKILKNKVFLTPEWSGGIVNGRIDFYLGAKKWAIELVRDGDKLDEQ